MLIYALTTMSNFLINAEDGIINYNSSNDKDSETNDDEGSKDEEITPT